MYNIYKIFYLIAVYKPQAANTVYSSWLWAVCRSKHVEPSINFGIMNSITRLHLAGYFYWFILVCGMFVCELSLIAWHAIRDSSQPNIPQTSTSGTHTHRQHTATYQINNLTTQTSRESSNTKHERRPPEDGQTIVTETCRVLIDVFYKHF